MDTQTENNSPTHKNTPHTTMSLEDTLLKLVEAVNRQAAATEMSNEISQRRIVAIDPAFGKEGGIAFTVLSEDGHEGDVGQLAKFITETASEEPPVVEPKKRTPKPKPEPTPEPEAETPAVEIPATGPIPVTMTPEQYRHAIRVRVREVISTDLVKKARWKKFMAAWKMKDIQSVEVGDLPDILAQVSEPNFLEQD